MWRLHKEHLHMTVCICSIHHLYHELRRLVCPFGLQHLESIGPPDRNRTESVFGGAQQWRNDESIAG
jgi:hypothetical protein